MEDRPPRGRVSIVGLGRLGLCQALTFEAAGWEVLGCAVHPAYETHCCLLHGAAGIH